MGDHNSLACFTRLFQDLLFDTARQFKDASPSASDIERDALTGISRIQHEGLPFLTVTLPKLGKAIDFALSNGGPLICEGWETFSEGKLPSFLGWLVRRVFNNESGLERADSCPRAVLALRQLTYAFYKLETPFTPAALAKACAAYVETEGSIESLNCDRSDPALELASNLVARVCAGFNPADIAPGHGPGTVATGEEVWEKYCFKRYYPNLHKVYPFEEYFVASGGHLCDSYRDIATYPVINDPTAKLVFVPKDSRGPRTISCEPLELMWVQQGIGRRLVDLIQAHPLTEGRVNFTRQDVNRYLAYVGSKIGKWATLDMKDASDRVSVSLVKRLFKKTCLLESMMAARSTCNLMPNGQTIRLNKFAPMGSALCFPVEALCFWSLSVSALVEHGGHPLSQAASSVFVYGDDIVCDIEDCDIIMQYLPTLGLRFNEAKCCRKGFFRESCGLDAYKGVDVTPIKFRSPLPSRQSHVQELLSWIQYSNALDLKGYSSSAYRIRRLIGDILPVEIPEVHHSDGPKGYVCYRTYLPKRHSLKQRFNSDLQRVEIRSLVAMPVKLNRARPGWERLFRWLAEANRKVNKSTLSPSSRGDVYTARDRVNLKSRWSPLD